MEKVSILEASRRLNIPQSAIRQYIREGLLKAERGGGASGGGWLVELPEEGWVEPEKDSYQKMAREMSPWWWPNPERSGYVHYVVDIGIEEILPQFLCGATSENIWTADNHPEESRCPECLEIAMVRGLSLSSSQ